MLEALLDPVSRAIANASIDDEPVTKEEEKALAESGEWFKHNEGIPHEQVLADLVITQEEIDNYREPKRSGSCGPSGQGRRPQPEQAHRHADSFRLAWFRGIGHPGQGS
jgi:hypothetical protein